MRALAWFRNDLRVADNTALHHARRHAEDGVVAAFLACPKQWREHDWGAAKVEFIIRNVAALSADLHWLNIPLRVVEVDRFGKAPRALAKLADEHGCGSLFFNHEYEVNERRRDVETTSHFEDTGREVRAYHDQTILRPDLLKTGDGRFYRVFTPFKKAWIEAANERKPLKALPSPRTQPPLNIPPDPIPDRLTGYKPSGVPADLWPGGQTEAKRRLKRFIQHRADRYKKNRDFPSMQSTSELSPYLSCGAVSPRQCLLAALKANRDKLDSGKEGITTWIGELIWREFYRHVLVGFPRVSMNRPFRLHTEKLRWDDDEEKFRRWCDGRTGVPVVDAAMRQMNQTGWMHNRLRMITAMYLSKDLWIDWRWGERYFMNRLLDGDLANNNGGWQWSASTGTDSVPYFRVFNPYTQAKKFDPDGVFIRRYCPELADLETKHLHDPTKIPPSRLKDLNYPEPLVDHQKARRSAIEAFRALNRNAGDPS